TYPGTKPPRPTSPVGTPSESGANNVDLEIVMQKTTRPILSASAPCWAGVDLLAMLLGMVPLNATAQDTRAASPVDPIWALVPGDATAAIAIDADPDSPQWKIAADLLDQAGLEDVVYGAINEFI